MEHLHILYGTLNLSDLFHAAVWAVATTTFFSCHRLDMPMSYHSHSIFSPLLGETTIKNATTFNPLHHITQATAPTFRDLANGSSSASIHIPWMKTIKQDSAS